MVKPPPSDEFDAWAEATLGFNPSSQKATNRINTNIAAARSAVQNHNFFSDVQAFLTQNRAGHKLSALNVTAHDPIIHVKSFDSIVSKIFRINILENENFPEAPNEGWVTPSNLYERLNDLIRTVITCRFFDEPKQISNKIAEIAAGHGLTSSTKAQAKDVGYYAYHVYITIPIALVDQNWNEFQANVQFEIQVTTEMQYMLYELTHTFYERERHEKVADSTEWKWRRSSPRFSASYISHSLHLLEGLIMGLYEQSGSVAISNSDPLAQSPNGPAGEGQEPHP